MTTRVKNNTINGISLKGIHDHWSMLDEDEQSESLKNFIENVKTKSQYVNNTFQSVKEDYRYLLLNKLDQNLVLLSLRLFILLSKNNHNEYLNTLLGEFIYQIKDLRKYHQNIVNENISRFFWDTFHTKETRKLFFDHIRQCCREKRSHDLLLILDELVLRIIKHHGLQTICNTIGLEESAKICKWFFDLSPDFYPWVQYEWVDKKYAFEYSGDAKRTIDGFTNKCGITKKTLIHEHTVYSGKVSNTNIGYGSGYPTIETRTYEPIIKAKNTRYDLCVLREKHELEFWELKRILNYTNYSGSMEVKYNDTFTSEDYGNYYFPSPTQVF